MSKRNEEYNTVNLLVKSNQAILQAKGFPSYPTCNELDRLAETLNNQHADKYIHESVRHEKSNDTFAVAATDKRLIISANRKTRSIAPRDTKGQLTGESVRLPLPEGGTTRVCYDDFGLNDKNVSGFIDTVKKSSVYKNSNLDVVFVESTASLKDNMIQNCKTHARDHAEMKSVSHSKKIGENINVMGISKEACNGCHTTLTNKNIEIDRERADNRVTNWAPDDEIQTVVVHQENRKNKCEANFKFASHNIDLSKKGLVRNAKNSMVIKPGGSVGLVSGILQVADTIENENIELNLLLTPPN
jgi:hypothetical protein